MEYTVTARDVWNRWRKVFPIALNFDVDRIYNIKNEMVAYDDVVYKVIKKATVAGILPDDENQDIFEVVYLDRTEGFMSEKADPDMDTISEDTLDRLIPIALSRFNYSAFRLNDTTKETDKNYIRGYEALMNLIAFLMVREIKVIEQSYGSVTKLLEKTRNQSHMSTTQDVKKAIRNSALFAEMGRTTFGYEYCREVYYGSMGVFSVITRGC